MLSAFLPHTVFMMSIQNKLRKIRKTEERLAYADPKNAAVLTKKLAALKAELF